MEVENTLNPGYQSALEFLYSFIDYERDYRWKYNDSHFNLDRFRKFLETIGNPHLQGRYVHIAGTNGKGSVAAMIANTLTSAGLRTGLYTSPHLITFRERIRINGSMISHEDVIAGVGRIKPAAGHFQGLTFFEVWTALAFDYFRSKSADVSVIEVGMGGRLDSTNVITPEVSVITSISMDHRGKLGETTAEIAREKAGIIKAGIPAVTAPQEHDVMDILEKRASEVGSRLVVAGSDVRPEIVNNRLYYDGLYWSLDNVTVPLSGSIQLENATVAFAALELLAARGFLIDSAVARKGIETVRWPGRLQTISAEPEIVIDGACNPDAMCKVSEYIAGKNRKEKTVAVVALCRDKEVNQVLGILGNYVSHFIVTQVNNPRIMKAHELAERVPLHSSVTIEPDYAVALRKAVALTGKDGLVIVTGSLYLIGEVLKIYGAENLEKI